jgi:glycerol-3-phosphate dehydrogenase
MTAERATLGSLPSHFDLIIIGGGITGAGLLREAVRTGASVLLVEQGDFASGTSSASSKLVHGGLRYLKSGQWRLTLESVRERQRLMHEAPGLVTPQTFLMPIYRNASPGKLTMQIGLWLYDRMGGSMRSASRWLDSGQALALEPDLRRDDLLGAMQYLDAGTDDARMVLRLIFDARAEGALALNYVRATGLATHNGRVTGVRLRDEARAGEREIAAAVVINATGAWGDMLPDAPPGAPRLRPLRGSHFVFPLQKLPIRHAISWLHPKDRRPIFCYPWEGAAVYGTTDLDHGEAGIGAARMTGAESSYLIEGLAHQFPKLRLGAADALATYSGVRPVVAGGKANPSAESRESAMWSSPGLVSITGGKLTTFRVTARHVLREASRQVPKLRPKRALAAFAGAADLGEVRLFGRLGAAAQTMLADVPREHQVAIDGTPYSWAELRWAARNEQVVHLQDLLMRRTRIGLTCPQGGVALLPRVREICASELGWSDSKWSAEENDYRSYWLANHAPPVA